MCAKSREKYPARPTTPVRMNTYQWVDVNTYQWVDVLYQYYVRNFIFLYIFCLVFVCTPPPPVSDAEIVVGCRLCFAGTLDYLFSREH